MREPVTVSLSLDERILPAQVFERFARRSATLEGLHERSRRAWLSFGKPGRDPSALASVVGSLASARGWTTHLELAGLSNHWDSVVGTGIAAHSHVVSYADGVLTIRAESTVWATQLTYLAPQLKATIAQRLNGLPLRSIIVTGPHAYSFRRGPYDIHGRGVRDTYF